MLPGQHPHRIDFLAEAAKPVVDPLCLFFLGAKGKNRRTAPGHQHSIRTQALHAVLQLPNLWIQG
ncbi:hypothetical protein D3C81_2035360 [compost metagenome]